MPSAGDGVIEKAGRGPLAFYGHVECAQSGLAGRRMDQPTILRVRASRMVAR